ncbi:hypothetical protein TKK_0014477 [Trichogramma kaykai]
MAYKPTTCKEAIERWKEKNNKAPKDAKEVLLCFQWPPIVKMDNSLSVLEKVEKLSLSTNQIDRITGINSLKNLKILSLGRNNIKTFSGLEAIGEHLQELWISYNQIEKIRGISGLKALRVLYMAHNLVKDWVEFNKLADLPKLEEFLFRGNPLIENLEEEVWREKCIKVLPNLKILDAVPVVT